MVAPTERTVLNFIFSPPNCGLESGIAKYAETCFLDVENSRHSTHISLGCAVVIAEVRSGQFTGRKNGRFGGPGRDRTDDLFHAMEARSQLRHRPTWKSGEIATS